MQGLLHQTFLDAGVCLVCASLGEEVHHAVIVQADGLQRACQLLVGTFLHEDRHAVQALGDVVIHQRLAGLLVDGFQCRFVNHGSVGRCEVRR